MCAVVDRVAAQRNPLVIREDWEMVKMVRFQSIQIPIAPRIAGLAERLSQLGDSLDAEEALRLADAVAFLEAEIAGHRVRAVVQVNTTRDDPQCDLMAA